MSMTLRIGLLVALVLVAGGATWWFFSRERAAPELTLYGNVDLREVDLAFNNSERIAEILVREGDQVKKGQLLARMDTSRLVPQVAQVAAMAEASKVDTANARRQYDRVAALLIKRFASKMESDNAKAALDAAAARQQANEAQLALLHQQLDDAQLVAPIDATVRSRVMEPGEMASPQRPILTLTVNDPKWVRVYVAEPDLVKVRPGMTAAISVDGLPDRTFPGWIGFISSVAEFTPKNIETEDLRTSLVYEVRVFVKDPQDELRLGMPATVRFPLAPQPAPPPS